MKYNLMKTNQKVNKGNGVGKRVVYYSKELDLEFIKVNNQWISFTPAYGWTELKETNYSVEWEYKDPFKKENPIPTINFNW